MKPDGTSAMTIDWRELSTGTLCGLLTLALTCMPGFGQTRLERAAIKQSVNQGKISIVSGESGGTYARFAQDLVNALNRDMNSDEQLRIIPILGLGSVQNLIDLIYLEDADVTFVQSDVLRAVSEGDLADSLLKKDVTEKRIGYVTRLYDEEIHVLTGPSIASFDELDGGRIAVGGKDSGSALSANLIFGFHGLAFEPAFLAGDQAIAALRRGEVDAVFMVLGKPAAILESLRIREGEGLHFVGLEVPKGLEDTYFDTALENEDYPGLIPSGQSVPTVSVSSVMAVYKFKPDQPRYKRLERFVEALFTAMPKLKKLGNGYHSKWQQVDVNAELPGWERFQPAAEHLSSR